MTAIHPTAIIAPGAKIAEDATIGPYCVIGPDVEIAKEAVLHAHVVVAGRTRIGQACRIFPFASLGHQPQDLKYHGEASVLEIGDGTVIRENVTVNPGTAGGGMVTRIGRNCLLMVGAHVAHDCLVGDHVILVNNATLGGHVRIADHAIIGGLSAVHQWVRIGEGAFVGGMSGVENDVIPFGMALGNRAALGGLNLVGLRRAQYPREAVHALRGAYRRLFSGDQSFAQRIDIVAREFGGSILVDKLVNFLQAAGDRAICMPRPGEKEDDRP